MLASSDHPPNGRWRERERGGLHDPPDGIGLPARVIALMVIGHHEAQPGHVDGIGARLLRLAHDRGKERWEVHQ
jgi:hypothetical protein